MTQKNNMTTQDLFKETTLALSSNKVRTALTMLGIVIGIASVIAMTAIGTGAQKSIENSIQSIGSNLLVVYPGAQRTPGSPVSTGRGSAKTLTLSDAESLKNLEGVKDVSPEITGRYQITAKGTNTNTSVYGVKSSYTTVRNLEIETGSFITDQQNSSASKVAVIGPTVQTDLFGEDVDVIGQTIRIKGSQFKIIGVTKAKGGTGFQNPDDMVYIPLSVASRYFSGDEYVNTISVAAENAEVSTNVQELITSTLLERHKISDPQSADFSTMNQADIIKTASSVTSTFTTLLAAVAGISLVVGGIGIMNMMLTTVTERTREIGLRKAVGAKRKDISRQFLAEAVVVTFLGGFIGILFGAGISFIVSKLGIVAASVSTSSILLAFGVSTFIGIVFGYYPAMRAAKLNPIEALRYE